MATHAGRVNNILRKMWKRRSASLLRDLGLKKPGAILILLCYKKPRRQHGQRGSERVRWVAICRRRVAMDSGLCRSVRTGSASGLVVGLHGWYANLDIGCLEWPRVA